VSDRPTGFDEGDELSPLGAAAPLPADAQQSPSKPKRRRRFRIPVGVGVAVGLLVVLGLALVPALGSSFKKTPQDRVGISYGGGPFEGQHYQRVVQPGHGLFFNGLFDTLYLYPADQQSYIISKAEGEGDVQRSDSVVAPSRDRVQVDYQVAMYFKLNTDLLRDFHEQLGLRYRAYTRSGWNNMIAATFRQQVENALQQETRRYDVADIFSNAELLTTIQDEVQSTLSDRLEAATGQPFFCGPTFEPGGECPEITFVIKKIELPERVVAAFEARRSAEIEIEQREAEARGIAALNEALAAAGDNYVLIKAIESGKIDFWVIPSESGLTLQTPSGPVDEQPQPGG
jgi:regulator of protease activity HflC (stomatin/prohibitin superfamily)